MTVIKIFSVGKNAHYRRLSDNFIQEMYIDGLMYMTVTNYVYSNMLLTLSYQHLIRRAKFDRKCTGAKSCAKYNRNRGDCVNAADCEYEVKTIRDQFVVLYQRELDDMKKNAITIALDAKLSQNPDLAQLLLDTRKNVLVYASQGEWMGVGSHKDKGKNEYGHSLMAARDILVGKKEQRIKDQDEKVRELQLYDTYLAQGNLVKLILSGNDLSEYVGLTPGEILKKMEQDGFSIMREPSQEIVIEEAKRKNYGVMTHPTAAGGILDEDTFMALRKPKILASLIRGEYLERLRTDKLERVPGVILGMYMDYLLKKSEQYTELSPEQYKEARVQQLLTIDVPTRVQVAREVKKLYEQGMLSESLSSEIDQRIKSLNIPEEKDSSKAKELAAAIKKESSKIYQETKKAVTSPQGKIVIWPVPPKKGDLYKGLSPLDDSKPIQIRGLSYPSITYYCIAQAFSYCCTEQRSAEKVTEEAYDKIQDNGIFQDLRSLEKKLKIEQEQYYYDRLTANATIALKVKFQNRESQNVLLSTDNKNLIYDDRRDEILGSKAQMKGNFIGKELMKIRAEIRADRKERGDFRDSEVVLSEKNLTDVFHNDFLMNWFSMRVRDMCNVILLMKDYLYRKHGIEQRVTTVFAENVLDHVYQPCSHIFAAVQEIKAPPPLDFTRIVKGYKGFAISAGDDVNNVINLMWKRLAVTIYYLIKQMKDATSNNVADVLSKVEHLASLNRQCEPILRNDLENCIFSALLNIISGITKVNQSYELGNEAQAIDFSAAAAIILNANSLAEQLAEQRKSGVTAAQPSSLPATTITEQEKDENLKQIEETLSQPPHNYSKNVVQNVLNKVNNADLTLEDILKLAFMFSLEEGDAKKGEDDAPCGPDQIRDRATGRCVKGVAPLNLQAVLQKELRAAQDKGNILWVARVEAEQARMEAEQAKDEVLADEVAGRMLRAEQELPPATFKSILDRWNIKSKMTPGSDEDEEIVEPIQVAEFSDEDIQDVVPDPAVTQKILNALSEIGVTTSDDIVYSIDEVITFIKAYSSMPKKVKRNRINFFASYRQAAT